MSELAKGFGDALIARARNAFEGEWESLPGDAREQVEAALRDAADLSMRAMGGEDVGEELAYVRATISAWEFVGASRAQAAIESAAAEAAEYAGKVILSALVALI